MTGSLAGRILVTGANGFVGRAVVTRLASEGASVIRAARVAEAGLTVCPNLDSRADWRPLLHGCEAVIHAAGRAHMSPHAQRDESREFRVVNVEGTMALARQAAEEGVRRFVFLSSIKAHGESSAPGRPFCADDPPEPCDPYGASKAAAEEALLALARRSPMEVVVIRPPLVYGPGVKANFLTMMRWLSRGLPLPFGAVVDNRRSFVALDNLVDLILVCLVHPAAANEIFLVSDGEDMSIADLLRRLAQAMGLRARLVPVPVSVLRALARSAGKESLLQRLTGNLQVDISKTRDLLGWTPPVTVEDGLRRAALAFER